MDKLSAGGEDKFDLYVSPVEGMSGSISDWAHKM